MILNLVFDKAEKIVKISRTAKISGFVMPKGWGMRYITDFHIHSKYSRATARDISLEKLDEWAKIKGIQILGTGDFTHPLWFKELKEKLEPVPQGLYKLKSQLPNYPINQLTNFILTTEISCIYSKNGRVRRIHLVVFAPDLETVAKINQKLGAKYNLRSDGRPILGLDAEELVKILLDISPDCFIVPAHVWTPWFSLFGSKSGFDSVEECFGKMTPYIFALETGLSADPSMCWRWSALDKFTLISNSDAHSLANLGREANVFDLDELSYQSIIQAIKTRKGFLYTIEFYPEEGKYHLDGHRSCGLRMTPAESREVRHICPKCGRPLTIGVLHRVEDLADRKEGTRPEGAPDYKSLIPLAEIIAEVEGVGKNSKSVQSQYQNLIKKGKNEFNILLNLSEAELRHLSFPRLAEAIIKARRSEVIKVAGYDGVYGIIRVFSIPNLPQKFFRSRQKTLF